MLTDADVGERGVSEMFTEHVYFKSTKCKDSNIHNNNNVRLTYFIHFCNEFKGLKMLHKLVQSNSCVKKLEMFT